MLSLAHQRGIASRKINVDLATSMGLYSGQRLRDGSVEPDDNGNTLCFPYFEQPADEVNTKYRWVEDGKKRFSQKPNSPKTFFNARVLFDDDMMTEFETGTQPLVITEGEFDALAAIQCGWVHTVSVPDGAPPARDKHGNMIAVPTDARDLDPLTDDKYAYLGRHMDRLQRVKNFYIATDADEQGQRLAKELVRRLGPARCYWVDYPKDEVVKDAKTGKMRSPKDLNEVLQYLGEDKVNETLENVKPWPVKGLFKFSDFPDVGEPITYATGLSPGLDELFRPYPGAFIVVTGIPNMGKSELAKQISVEMARVHGWHTVMFAGEEPIKPYLHNSLRTKFLKKHRKLWTPSERESADDFVEKYFQVIANDPRDDEEEIDIEFLLDKAATAVFRNNTKLLIIDPWNELEHARDKHFSTTEYTGEAIRKLKRFGRSYDVCVMVVAHPKKIDGQPGLYDIADSAHWANKPDLALIVHSDDPFETHRDIIIPKVRFSAAGKKGVTPMQFDLETERYIPVTDFDEIAANANAA
ncbi:bifunctional DNA primase/helicase [Methylobacterium sp. WL120]|uniref:bifunctional DNA primase/helicase n=1 Tax=Methylobacterium sp. WL120 TaxID=2603887 RepID=UPI0011CB2414|nr:bifunctional DNA primase/helicase [Methylobacterium sp. WL120]TXM69631.1 AAA family ATPase [Methylobacterium sp. WL120]